MTGDHRLARVEADRSLAMRLIDHRLRRWIDTNIGLALASQADPRVSFGLEIARDFLCDPGWWPAAAILDELQRAGLMRDSCGHHQSGDVS